MDFNDVIQAIGSVGFPIIACAALFWMVNTSMKELTTAIQELTTTLRGGNIGSGN